MCAKVMTVSFDRMSHRSEPAPGEPVSQRISEAKAIKPRTPAKGSAAPYISNPSRAHDGRKRGPEGTKLESSAVRASERDPRRGNTLRNPSSPWDRRRPHEILGSRNSSTGANRTGGSGARRMGRMRTLGIRERGPLPEGSNTAWETLSHPWPSRNVSAPDFAPLVVADRDHVGLPRVALEFDLGHRRPVAPSAGGRKGGVFDLGPVGAPWERTPPCRFARSLSAGIMQRNWARMGTAELDRSATRGRDIRALSRRKRASLRRLTHNAMRHIPIAVAALLALTAASQDQRPKDAAPKAGIQAPDFKLKTLGDPDKEIHLSSFKDKKPVLLIFGSYT